MCSKEQKIFGLRKFVGGDFIDSMLVESSGALSWIGGNYIFVTICRVLVKMLKKVKALRRSKLWKGIKKFIKTNRIMKLLNVKSMGKLIIGMCVVATVFGK